MKDIVLTSATKLARAIRTKRLSSAEVLDACLDRIEAVNPKLNAVVQLTADAARKRAREAEKALAKGEVWGPLHGVPFTVKDALEVAGVVSSGGTLGRANFVPDKDATAVARMKAAGGVLLGKTNLTEACLGWESDNLVYGRTSNPYDLSRIPGGSSGGEGAIVAAGGSPLGIGSDAGGSVRVPSHYCGLAGIKPTSGRTPRTGHWPRLSGFPDAFNQLGPLARRVEDLPLALSVICGPDGVDPHVVPMPLPDYRKVKLAGLRVAMYTDNGICAAQPETKATVLAAAKALEDVGVIVEERRPPDIEEAHGLLFSIWGADGGQGVRDMLKAAGSTRTHKVVAAFQEKQGARATPAAEMAKMLMRLDAFRSDMLAFMDDYDAILCPTGAGPAVPHGATLEKDGYKELTYTSTYNLTGWPAGVVRCGTSGGGLPISAHVAAKPWREDVVIAVLAHLEQALGGYTSPAL